MHMATHMLIPSSTEYCLTGTKLLAVKFIRMFRWCLAKSFKSYIAVNHKKMLVNSLILCYNIALANVHNYTTECIHRCLTELNKLIL